MGLITRSKRGARRLTLAAALLLVAGSVTVAATVLPGAYKIVDGGKAVRKKPTGMKVARVINDGPDNIQLSSKGTALTETVTVLAGEKYALKLPKGAKNVKLVDGTFDNGMGAKGYVFWSKQLPTTGGWGGTGGGQ